MPERSAPGGCKPLVTLASSNLIKISTLHVRPHCPVIVLDPFLYSKYYSMELLHPTYSPAAYTHESKKSLISQFVAWCEGQEKNRLFWVAIIIVSHGCFITPLTVLAVTLAGNSMWLWSFAIAAMTMSLVSNLAAMPTKVTLPIFFLSLLIDLGVLINCVAVWVA
ncbi:MAG: hypothetical protein H7Y01_04645 [Ferruginibacter sp.]|nr:hypothetical protein [Chitinophagaceae bacterium]